MKKFPAAAFAIFALSLGVSSMAASPQEQTSGATDVTVRLFFSQDVNALTITPTSSLVTFTQCAGCKAQPLKSPIHVQLHGSILSLDGSPMRQLELAGALRVETSGGRSATAAGKWKLLPARDGLHLMLTLSSERYVMAVLASEASSDEPPASLQALAITARSFALTHLHRHSTQGFDLCDSTHCQALRLTSVSESIRQAVEETAGETIWSGSERAAAYFTQNCGGVTEDAARLWGGPPRAWLASHPDPYCQRASSAWHASLNQFEIRQLLALAGSPTHAEISNVHIAERDASGRATTLEFVTDTERIKVPAATFRFAVGRSLGWNRLRSDWYSINFVAGSAQFDGKGFGHGVGLCQAGAAAMAAEHGADTRAILKFYFPGSEVRIAPWDHGWQRIPGQGWTLFTAAHAEDGALVHEGDIAWAHANSLFRTDHAAPVTVRIFPSTDLFRSSTGSPGWVIGTTRGDTISLQPLRVIQAHEPLEGALLHEMLHTLIERDCNGTTPLWLREGLVEALMSGSASHEVRTDSMNSAELNATLFSAKSANEARRAHHAAGAAAQRLIDAYGIAAVRGWLSNGVPSSALAKAGLR